MVNGGQRTRAFRPSYFSAIDDYDEETERAKEVNVLLYAARVRAGLPIFDNSPFPGADQVDTPPERAQS